MPGPAAVDSSSAKPRKMGVYWYCFLLSLPVFLLVGAAFGLLVNGLHRLDSAALRISEDYLPDYQARHPLQNRVQVLRRAVLSIRLSDNMDLCRKALADARHQLDKNFVDSTLSSTETTALRGLLDELERAKRTASRHKAELAFVVARLERRVNRLAVVSGRVFSLPEILASSPYDTPDPDTEKEHLRQALTSLQAPLAYCQESSLKKTNICQDLMRNIDALERIWQRHHQAQVAVYNLSSAIDFRLRDWFSRFEAANSLAIRKAMETMETERMHMEMVIKIAIVGISLSSLLCFLIFMRRVIFPISLASQQLRRLEASGDCENIPPSKIRELDALFGMLPRLKNLIAGMKAHSRNLAEECSEFRQMSLMDELCGVPNRRSLDVALAEVTQERALAVFLLDVDNFKAYNDTLGHQKGDEALRLVAQEGARVVNGSGRFFRYGGEEFCVLLLDDDVYRAVEIAEDIRRSVRALAVSHPGNPPGVLTVSIGVAVREAGEALSGDELLHQADISLYQAKGAGRDCVRVRL